VHGLDARGPFAFTGRACVGWAGHRVDPRGRYTVAGNMLVGPRVLEAMAEAFERSEGEELSERLLRALEAGQAAGGDKRGKQSAALLVASPQPRYYHNLRVDDHPDPVAELRRVYGVVVEHARRLEREYEPHRAAERTAGEQRRGRSLSAQRVRVRGLSRSTVRAPRGSKPLEELLQPAIEYAERGFPVMERTARRWGQLEARLRRDPDAAATYLIGGRRAPRPGEMFRNERLAATLRTLAQEGVEAFYEGAIAEQIVRASEARGGLLAPDDLAEYQPEWVEPLSVRYRDARVWELPPNGQGLVALLALGLLDGLALGGMEPAERLHLIVEAIKLAFDDGRKFIADPRFAEVPIAELLSPDHLARRRALIGERALDLGAPRAPEGGTVYLTVVDEERTVVSYIESLYMPFGSGVVAGETGVLLQNRGALFVLDPEHPNRLEPRKRPYHTIIPAMAFRGERPWLSFGVVGGFMQPQGHVQLLVNLLDLGMELQEALEVPRVRYLLEGRRIALEEGFPEGVREALERRGHEIAPTEGFGGAQAILIDPETGALAGASDPRKDGCAQGF